MYIAGFTLLPQLCVISQTLAATDWVWIYGSYTNVAKPATATSINLGEIFVMSPTMPLTSSQEFITEEDWSCVNISIKTTKTNQFDLVKCVFNPRLDYYCRKQIRFNLGDWWIMLLHHIGLPPAINRYPKLIVSGNIFNYNYIHKRRI